MYQKILNFIKYNNAFTIIFVICFFGFGITFAASPAARDSIYSSTETITSIDNSLIISTDLDNFNFNLKINSVTEDAGNYYADYSYNTLAIENGAWQNVEVDKTLKESKEDLNGGDFGLYAAKQLGDNINFELSNLKRVQTQEKAKGESQKVVTTEYSGLIGKMINPKENVIEGYNPVIPEATSTDNVVPFQPTPKIVEPPPITEPQENPVTNTILPQPESSQEATGTVENNSTSSQQVDQQDNASSTPGVSSSTPESTPTIDDTTSTSTSTGTSDVSTLDASSTTGDASSTAE